MANRAGRIGKLEIRCACGGSFENADTYGRHKRLCGTHRKGHDAVSTAPNHNRKVVASTAEASISASSSKRAACRCGRTFKDINAFRQHQRYCAVHKQQTIAHSDPSPPAKDEKLYSGAGLASAAGKCSTPLSNFTAKKIQCRCGKSFGSEKALNDHLRDSKTHEAKNSGSSSTSKVKRPGLSPFTAPHSPATSVPPVSGPKPGTVPFSMLSLESLLQCSCGHVFETQRALDLHKRDSLIHKRQADPFPFRKEQSNDTLVSSFASLNLVTTSTGVIPCVGRFACICGCIFTHRKALEQHERDARQYAWQEKRARDENTFQTPRPQYHQDEYLRDMASGLAGQYRGGG